VILPKITIQLGLALLLLLLASACSHDLFIPANRFDFPETHGKWLWGRALVRYQGTTRVEPLPSFTETPPRLTEPTLVTEGGVLNSMGLSADSGIKKNLDLFVKMPIAPSPTLLGVKYQFKGHTYDDRKKGDFALAATLAGGYTRQDSDLQSDSGKIKVQSQGLAYDAAIVAGYRFKKDLMVYGGPFYANYSTKGQVAQPTQTFDYNNQGSLLGLNAGGFQSFNNGFGAAIEVAYTDLQWSYGRSLSKFLLGFAASKEF
jgi:hypothetical protein